jgi:hypothetical protein
LAAFKDAVNASMPLGAMRFNRTSSFPNLFEPKCARKKTCLVLSGIFVATTMMIDRTLELTNRIRELCAKIDAAAGDDEEIKNLTAQLRIAIREHLSGVSNLAERSYPMQRPPNPSDQT